MSIRQTTTWIAVATFALGVLAAQHGKEDDPRNAHGTFTGDVKLVFYVRDVQAAVRFYTDALGFTFQHFYDHVSGDSVKKWTREEPPIYAEMSYAGRRFGIHAPTSDADRRCVGGAKVYFRVRDLEAHHRRATAWQAKPSEIIKRSWMDMFHVVDPDGNRIYFAFTDDEVHGNPWSDQ